MMDVLSFPWIDFSVAGVVIGSIYALRALGIGLIFGIMRLINFAHAEFITVTVYILVLAIGLGFPVALFFAAGGALWLAAGGLLAQAASVVDRPRSISSGTWLTTTANAEKVPSAMAPMRGPIVSWNAHAKSLHGRLWNTEQNTYFIVTISTFNAPERKYC